ncbi:MAG: hypothetical protein HEQ35_21425 [Gloeotrichia echinulata IR180]
MSLNEYVQINLSLDELLSIYHSQSRVLSRFGRKVSVSIRQEGSVSSSQSLISFTEALYGNYLLIATADVNKYWLLRARGTINTYEYKTVQLLFDCQGYESDTGNKFVVKKPAIVSLAPNNKDGKLEQRGILEFDLASTPSRKSVELEQAEEENQKLRSELVESNSQLTKIKQEREQVLSRLKQYEEECKQLSSRLAQLEIEKVSPAPTPKPEPPVPPEPTPPKPPEPIPQLLELLYKAAFTGFEGGLLLIAIVSLLGTSLIGAGFWIGMLILASLIFLQHRLITTNIERLIIALSTLLVILIVPAFQTILPIQSTLPQGLFLFLLAILSGLSAVTFISLYRLIFKVLEKYF